MIVQFVLKISLLITARSFDSIKYKKNACGCCLLLLLFFWGDGGGRCCYFCLFFTFVLGGSPVFVAEQNILDIVSSSQRLCAE